MAEFTCATWNIHGGVGRDGVERLDRIAATLRLIAADVVALQEVDCRSVHAGGGDKLQWLARECGYQAVAGPARHEADGYFGNAVLTRLPVRSVRHVDISVAGREPRALMDTVLQVGGRSLHLMVTHFGLRMRERQRQAAALVDLAAAHRDSPVVVAGDFNEWRPRALAITQLDTALGCSHAVRSFPARFPVFKLDRIWARAPASISSVAAVRSGPAAVASDHLPVVAKVCIREGGSTPAD